LNVGEDEVRPVRSGCGHRLGRCVDGGDHRVTEALDDIAEINGDEQFVLNNEDAGAGLRFDFCTRASCEIGCFARPHTDDGGHLAHGEPLYSGEEQGLPIERGERAQPLLRLGCKSCAEVRRALDIGARPNRVEYSVEANARIKFGVERGVVINQSLQGCCDEGVAALLRAGERPGVTPQKRQVRRQRVRKPHVQAP